MKEILIFAGTTEGRRLSERLLDFEIPHTVCVATEYGEICLKEHSLLNIHCGRMNQEEIRAFILDGKFSVVVDATHPYADVVTQNIKAAMTNLKIPYLRLKREISADSKYENIQYFKNHEDCVNALKRTDGNILLTTGSKDLNIYCSDEEIRKRLYVRILPGMESLKLCMDQKIAGKQILALQGPFTKEMNLAMIKQYQIHCLVTKASGMNGGYNEKIKAAEEMGIGVYVIGTLVKDDGNSFEEICNKLMNFCGNEIIKEIGFDIILAGVGMGSEHSLTKEVHREIQSADILLGAQRMIAGYHPNIEKRPYYQAEQIIPYLEGWKNDVCGNARVKVVVLFSGDSGFYSGCKNMYQSLMTEIETGRLNAVITVMPGISSISYLASRIGESYHDAAICSMHGKELNNLTWKIREQKKTFLLMSGVSDIHKLGYLLEKEGLSHCTVIAGYQLSYPQQQIMELTPKQCLEIEQEGLYTCCIKNPLVKSRRLTHGKADKEFFRDRVPMTKEEIRAVSICKLRLCEDSVVYDIGSGSGSVAIEIAELSDLIQVYAIEKKPEAISLIERNLDLFYLNNVESNIKVIQAEAPEGLSGIPAATHAFIGGSGGKLKKILAALYQINQEMRIVINAISMETICEIKEILSIYPIQDEEVIQIQINRAKPAGAYHLMQAENPIWICSFNFHR